MNYIYTMTTQNGTQVNLTMNDLAFAHNLYRFFATREYIQDNYPSLTDQQLDIVTDRTLAIEDSYGYDEDDAIEQAIKEEELAWNFINSGWRVALITTAILITHSAWVNLSCGRCSLTTQSKRK